MMIVALALVISQSASGQVSNGEWIGSFRLSTPGYVGAPVALMSFDGMMYGFNSWLVPSNHENDVTRFSQFWGMKCASTFFLGNMQQRGTEGLSVTRPYWLIDFVGGNISVGYELRYKFHSVPFQLYGNSEFALRSLTTTEAIYYNRDRQSMSNFSTYEIVVEAGGALNFRSFDAEFMGNGLNGQVELGFAYALPVGAPFSDVDADFFNGGLRLSAGIGITYGSRMLMLKYTKDLYDYLASSDLEASIGCISISYSTHLRFRNDRVRRVK